MLESLPLIEDLRARQLLVQHTVLDELQEHLTIPRTVYCGFDPTADSLHIGHLVPLIALRRMQGHGHRAIALIGGATGLIGDPSFKSAERGINSVELISDWTAAIATQIRELLQKDDPSLAPLVVNNMDWFVEMKLLPFLRDVGKSFSVNAMVRKDSVRQRIEREGDGISFTEFSYMLLQAYDFAELNRRYSCTLQIGGSDQWGNMTCGIELCRRRNRQEVHALTLPLVTKADGSKFGKSESGTVWLDARRTSPYAFYQFWMNTQDADVYRFLRYFTFLSEKQLIEIENSDRERSAKPEASRILADELTRFVHGQSALESTRRITEALFSSRVDSLGLSDLEQLAQDGLPCSELSNPETPLTRLLVEAGVANNGKQVKDALAHRAVTVNGVVAEVGPDYAAPSMFAREKALFGKYFLLKMGKKHHHLLRLPVESSI